MRTALFILIAVLLMVAPAVAHENKTQEPKPVTPATEETKNEVEQMLEDAKKRGDTILAACSTEDCGGADKKIDSGVINGRALQLPKPVYPSLARKAHVQGEVRVQVIIGKDGTVVAAAAISGHPLLLTASVAAARDATFTPTEYHGKAVKVVGVLQYNFIAQ